MDQITLLRRLADDIAEPDPDAIAAARARLLERATGVVAPTRRTEWFGSRGSKITLAVVAAAAAAVVASIAIVGPGPGTSATAAEALGRAATATITTSDPVVGAGQYLKVETSAAYLAWDDNTKTAYLAPEVDDLYIPADRSGEWVSQKTAVKPTVFFGGPAAHGPANRDWQDAIDRGLTQTARAAGGKFPVVREFGGGSLPVDDLATMPREPRALLAYLGDSLPRSERADTGIARQTDIFDHVTQLLEAGTAPADLRAGLYRALALLPDVTIADSQATLDGHTGVAFGLKRDHVENQQELIIDPDTGLFIGEREILAADYLGVPAGTSMAFTAVLTSVVDTAP